MKRLGRAVAAVALIVAGLAGATSNVRASAQTSGPSITLQSRASAFAVGDPVPMEISGFVSTFVTISICGNEARRGSQDCDLPGSVGLRLNPDGASGGQVYITTPPAPCPCVIRVSNQTNDEVAVVPIVIIGAPVAPVVDLPIPADAVHIGISVKYASSGTIDFVRAAMGGDARYAVTVKVTNRTTVPLRRVALFGNVGRSETDNLATLDIPNPDEILPGQTWSQVVYTRIPSPTFGTFVFKVWATGAGPVVVVSTAEKHRTPVLLALMILVLLMFVVVVYRWLTRRRLRKQSAQGDAVGDDDVTVEERVPHYTS